MLDSFIILEKKKNIFPIKTWTDHDRNKSKKKKKKVRWNGMVVEWNEEQ